MYVLRNAQHMFARHTIVVCFFMFVFMRRGHINKMRLKHATWMLTKKLPLFLNVYTCCITTNMRLLKKCSYIVNGKCLFNTNTETQSLIYFSYILQELPQWIYLQCKCSYISLNWLLQILVYFSNHSAFTYQYFSTCMKGPNICYRTKKAHPKHYFQVHTKQKAFKLCKSLHFFKMLLCNLRREIWAVILYCCPHSQVAQSVLFE